LAKKFSFLTIRILNTATMLMGGKLKTKRRSHGKMFSLFGIIAISFNNPFIGLGGCAVMLFLGVIFSIRVTENREWASIFKDGSNDTTNDRTGKGFIGFVISCALGIILFWTFILLFHFSSLDRL